MAASSNNPFRPGAGAVPAVWAGRAGLLPTHDHRRTARLRGEYTSATVFIGPSGIGKSVLVNRFARQAANARDVVLNAVRVAKRSDPIAQLAAEVEQATRHIAGATKLVDQLAAQLDRVQLIGVKGVRSAAEKGGIANPHLEVRDALIGLASTLARENHRRPRAQRALVIRLDEFQNAGNEQRSKLLSALGDVLEHTITLDVPGASLEHHLPVLLYVTGLPDLLNRATNVDRFRRRFDTIALGMLTDSEVIEALLNTPLPDGVTFAPDAATALANIIAGDPYLFQLVGKHAWDAATSSTIDLAAVEAADDATYPQRLQTIEAASADIPEGEATVLDAIYELVDAQGRVSGAEVAAHLTRDAPQIAPAAQRLERRAAIRRERGLWRIEHRLLHRYRTTGDIV
jgi:hypothetical protein